MICEDGRCGTCALCVATGREAADEAVPPGALARMRLGLDLEAPELVGSLAGAAGAIAVAAAASATFLLAHGASHLGPELAVALGGVVMAALLVRRTPRWRGLLALAPLALVISVDDGALHPGSLGCLFTELAVMVPGVVAGTILARRRRGGLAAWVLSCAIAAVLAATAVHAGCPHQDGLGHTVATHVLPATLLVAMLPRLARRLAPLLDPRGA